MMSRRNHKRREPQDETVVRFEPNYECQCMNCDQSPTVEGVNAAGKVVYASDMCGPCTFGTAAALDPDTWNS